MREYLKGIKRKHILACALLLVLTAAGLCLPFRIVKAGRMKTGTSLSDYQDISRVLNNSEDCFAVMSVDSSSGSIVKDGEDGSLAEEYDAEKKEVKEAVKSKKGMKKFLEEKDGDTIYQVDKDKNGDYAVTAPYQTKRLIIKSLMKNDTLGAARVYYNTKDKETILEFDSDEATKTAYEQAVVKFGEEGCFLDEMFFTEDVTQSVGTASSSKRSKRSEVSKEAKGKCVSWGTAYMGMDSLKKKAVSLGFKNQVLVAVLDSGVTRKNSLFSGGRVIGGWNFAYGNPNYADDYGHGTHVAGIIADATPSNVKILAVKTVDNKGRGTLYALLNSLRYALECNPQVINISLGLPEYYSHQYTIIDEVAQEAWNRGIPICCASGNAAINVQYFYPANLSTTISVSAINSKGKRASAKLYGRKIYFSNYGKKIDFVAPGSNILSASRGSSYRKMTGTSMAAPHITAAIAYLKMKDPNISVPAVKTRLRKLSKDLGSKGKDKYYGWGCPQMKKLFGK